MDTKNENFIIRQHNAASTITIKNTLLNISDKSIMSWVIARSRASQPDHTSMSAIQFSVEAVISSWGQADFKKSNNADLHLDVANVVCEDEIPFSLSKKTTFNLVVKCARAVQDDFKYQRRESISGSFLDISYDGSTMAYCRALICQADVFGLAFISNSATISNMPLINFMVISRNTQHTSMEIHVCTQHMTEGDKKGASYTAVILDPHDTLNP